MIGNCVSWGYASWKVGSALHAACTRMGTADHCGTGVSYTKDDTLIDMFDGQGISAPEGDPSFAFEAGWGPDGAVCVSRPRYDAVTTSGAPVQPSCWSSLSSCGDWGAARVHGASIATRRARGRGRSASDLTALSGWGRAGGRTAGTATGSTR